MLILNAMGSSFPIKYMGEEYTIHYRFKTGEDENVINNIIEHEGQLINQADFHKMVRQIVTKIEGLTVSVEGKEKKVETAKELYSYPLSELQTKIAIELNKDHEKKQKLTTKK